MNSVWIWMSNILVLIGGIYIVLADIKYIEYSKNKRFEEWMNDPLFDQKLTKLQNLVQPTFLKWSMSFLRRNKKWKHIKSLMFDILKPSRVNKTVWQRSYAFVQALNGHFYSENDIDYNFIDNIDNIVYLNPPTILYGSFKAPLQSYIDIFIDFAVDIVLIKRQYVLIETKTKTKIYINDLCSSLPSIPSTAMINKMQFDIANPEDIFLFFVMITQEDERYQDQRFKKNKVDVYTPIFEYFVYKLDHGDNSSVLQERLKPDMLFYRPNLRRGVHLINVLKQYWIRLHSYLR